MNKRTYNKILKGILKKPIPYTGLTSLEERVRRKFDRRCCVIVKRYMTLFDAEDDYYRMVSERT